MIEYYWELCRLWSLHDNLIKKHTLASHLNTNLVHSISSEISTMAQKFVAGKGTDIHIPSLSKLVYPGKIFTPPRPQKNCGLSLQENYTNWVTATCQQNSWQLLWIEGVGAMDPHSHLLSFLDRSRYCFFQAAPQLCSQGCIDPFSDPQLLRKSGSARNVTQDLWICG
jgi:hypothetical protein